MRGITEPVGAELSTIRAAGRTAARGSSRFWVLLGSIVGLAIAARLAFVLGFRFQPQPFSDEPWFHDVAENLAAGRGFVWIEPARPDRYVPTAWHPPGFPWLLAGFDVLGIDSRSGHRILLSIIAGVGVMFVGLVGRRVAGEAVGLVAAGIVAIHPLWLIPVGVLASESLVLVLVPVLVYVSLRCIETPRTGWFVGLGIVIAMTALTRSEALGLVILSGAPVAFIAAGRTARALRLFGVVAVTALLLVTPWAMRNHARFGSATLSTNLGPTVAGTYCDETFRPGSDYGSFLFDCVVAAGIEEFGFEQPGFVTPRPYAEGDRALTRHAAEYASGHVPELPGVMGARVARMLGLWSQTPDRLDIGVAYWPRGAAAPEAWGATRPGFEQLGVWLNRLLLVLVVAGAIRIPREAWSRWGPVLVPVVLSVLVAMLVQGTMRTRTIAEPSLALYAAFGITASWRAAQRRGPVRS